MGKKKTCAMTKAPPSNKKTIDKTKEGSTKQKAKNKKKQQQQILEQSQLSQKNKKQQISDEDEQGDSEDQNQYSDDSNQGSDDDEDDDESSITPVKPENYAVKQMQFRQRRGTKMNYLMTRKKQQQQDPFWAEHKGYFGDLNASDDEDQEDYVQSSSGKDQFDSDFGQTQSQHEDEQENQNQKKIIDQFDEQKEKEKKRKVQLMKKINAYKQKPEKVQKIQKTQKGKQQKSQAKKQIVQQKQDVKNQKTQAIGMKKQKSQTKPHQQLGNRYIHQVFTQEQLLGEAAHTQYYNWLSLKKLISIQTEKKDFTKKAKHIDGPKVVYRDKLKENGSRQITYQLSGVNINQIEDLTSLWQTK